MRMASRIAAGLAVLALAMTLAMALLLLLIVDSESHVGPRTAASAADIERALQIARLHDPRRQRVGVVRALAAEQRDLNLLFEHVTGRWPSMSAKVVLEQATATVLASWGSPLGFAGRWINVEVRWKQEGRLPEVDLLRVGHLRLPAWCAAHIVRLLLKWRGHAPDTSAWTELVRHVDLRPGALLVFYAWQVDTAAKLLGVLVPPDDQERLRVYSDALVALVARQKTAPTVSIAKLLPPLFELARERSLAGGDAAAENRAAILALAFYANQLGLETIVPAARSWPQAKPMVVTLAGRTDLPLHYLISAAVASTSGSPLADAVGLYKEVADSRGGSGFSFNDLAADRAGTRFGERAVRNAQGLQGHMLADLNESGLLPHIADLPEDMQSREFARRFGGVGGTAYRVMLNEIESRLNTVPALR